MTFEVKYLHVICFVTYTGKYMAHSEIQLTLKIIMCDKVKLSKANEGMTGTEKNTSQRRNHSTNYQLRL